MPELPEVETVRAGLEARLKGRVLATVDQRRPDLRIPFPDGFKARLEGRLLAKVGRRGKYLLWRFSGSTVLISHLGMSGRLVVRNGDARSEPEPHEHVVLGFRGGLSVAFRDPRRFGLMTLAGEHELGKHPLLAGLGPEPLEDGFDGPTLAAALHGRRTSIKAALLNQRIVAGLGNIYACEALFRAKIAPDRTAGSIRGSGAGRLAAAIRLVLADAIQAGGSSLRDYVQASGELGTFQHQWAVYGKVGEPCGACRPGGRCRVMRMVQGGRSTFWCPRRQR
jgi:formamidopyrimidine-DNA glycosylase